MFKVWCARDRTNGDFRLSHPSNANNRPAKRDVGRDVELILFLDAEQSYATELDAKCLSRTVEHDRIEDNREPYVLAGASKIRIW